MAWRMPSAQRCPGASDPAFSSPEDASRFPLYGCLMRVIKSVGWVEVMPSHGSALRAVAMAAVVVHLAAIAVYLSTGLVASGPITDWLRPIPIAGLYAAPAVLAIAGLRGRVPLLLAAAIAAGLLAIFPFSLHSFVLAPVALVYATAYAPLSRSVEPRGTAVAVVACPILLVAALVVLVIEEHPVCYERLRTGEVTFDRSPGAAASGSAVIGGDSDVVSRGCTSDTVVWWEALASLTLTSAAIATGLLSVPGSRVGSSPRSELLAHRGQPEHGQDGEADDRAGDGIPQGGDGEDHRRRPRP